MGSLIKLYVHATKLEKGPMQGFYGDQLVEVSCVRDPYVNERGRGWGFAHSKAFTFRKKEWLLLFLNERLSKSLHLLSKKEEHRLIKQRNFCDWIFYVLWIKPGNTSLNTAPLRFLVCLARTTPMWLALTFGGISFPPFSILLVRRQC